MQSNLTAQEAADALGKEKQTIINMIKDGRIKGHKDEKNQWQIPAPNFYTMFPDAHQIVNGKVSKIDREVSNLDTRQSQNLTSFDSDLTVKLKEELAKVRAERDGLVDAVRREREIATEYRTDKIKAEEREQAARAQLQALTDQREKDNKAAAAKLEQADKALRKRWQEYDQLLIQHNKTSRLAKWFHGYEPPKPPEEPRPT